MSSKKVMLIVLDGLGAAPNSKGNAVTLARPANLTKLWDSYPNTYLQASGPAVGLPEGIYGNSEVGHMNIGAGKVLLQNLPRINRSIESGAFYSNQSLMDAVAFAQSNKSNIHIMGNLSDGGVHSHIDHFLATLNFMYKLGVDSKVYFHIFTDGRDASPRSAREYLEILQEEIDKNDFGKIASLCGRAFAMDRNRKWERLEKAYLLLTEGKGVEVKSWEDGINLAYNADQNDEYIEPIIIKDKGKLPIIKDKDVVVFLNYRADRAIQLTDAFLDPNFDSFPGKKLPDIYFISMVPYRKNYPQHVIMPKETVSVSLGRIVADANKRQLRIAESEKFPHVTYFFNGGNAVKYNGEDRIEVPSPNVTTYDQKPEMSAMQILSVLKQRISLNIYDLIVLNLANTDMVGHTGNLQACIRSVQVVDMIVAELVRVFTSFGGTIIITADHGNVEEVLKLDTGEIDTEHSINPVPFIIVDPTLAKTKLPYGKLSDITPTILELMELNQPKEMVGQSLLYRATTR